MRLISWYNEDIIIMYSQFHIAIICYFQLSMYTTITSDGYTVGKLLLSLFVIQYNDIHSYIIKHIVYMYYL